MYIQGSIVVDQVSSCSSAMCLGVSLKIEDLSIKWHSCRQAAVIAVTCLCKCFRNKETETRNVEKEDLKLSPLVLSITGLRGGAMTILHSLQKCLPMRRLHPIYHQWEESIPHNSNHQWEESIPYNSNHPWENSIPYNSKYPWEESISCPNKMRFLKCSILSLLQSTHQQCSGLNCIFQLHILHVKYLKD